ncbi:hypothetical protein V6N12_032079 [Hibiscus sabdariffa]|uniref:Uncharacterized protein n=1 Tax=Hibiscus sabdariffa TaxID=183260 RepID=A0ABR2BZ01_9ROSI
MDGVTASKQRLAYAKACFVDSTGSGVAKDTGNDVIVGRNQKKSRVDPGPSKSSLEGLPAVAITPFPVKSGKGTVRGSNNQFAILSDKTNLCASIVDVNHVIGDCGDPPLDVSISVGDALGVSVDIDNVSVGLSVDVGVTTTVAQAVDHAGNVLGVFDDSSLDGVLIAGYEGSVVEEMVMSLLLLEVGLLARGLMATVRILFCLLGKLGMHLLGLLN